MKPEEIKFDYRYSVKIIRSGQPRAYADTEREYLIFFERYQEWGLPPKKDTWSPAVPGIFGGIAVDENGVPTDSNARQQLDKLVKALTQRYFRREDNDPNAGWHSPFLKWMKVNKEEGTIHIFITEEYTD